MDAVKFPEDRFAFDIPLSEARAWFNKTLNEGVQVVCPCCYDESQIYKRSFSAGMALSLLIFYKDLLRSGKDWIHIKDIHDHRFHMNHEHARLRHWGVIKKHQDLKATWKMTDKGIAFIKGEIRIPEFIVEYRSELLRYEGREVLFRDCLSKDNWFDLDQLLSRRVTGLNYSVGGN